MILFAVDILLINVELLLFEIYTVPSQPCKLSFAQPGHQEQNKLVFDIGRLNFCQKLTKLGMNN